MTIHRVIRMNSKKRKDIEMKQDLNKYIKKYKSNLEKANLLSTDEVRTIVEKADSSEYINNDLPMKRKFNMKIVLSSIGAVMLAGLIYLAATNKLGLWETKNHDMQKSKNQTGQLDSTKKNNRDDVDYFNWTDLRIIELTDKELEKLGIMKTNSGYVVISESFFYKPNYKSVDQLKSKVKPDSGYSVVSETDIYKAHYKLDTAIPKKLIFPSRMYKSYLKAGYPTTAKFLLKREENLELEKIRGMVIPYKGWKNDEYSMIAPIAISSRHFKGQTNFMSEAWDIAYSPLLKGSNSTLEELFKNFANLTPKRSIREVPSLSRLVTIRVRIGDKNKKVDLDPQKRYEEYRNAKCTYAEFLIWYLPNEEFLNALPERYSKPLRKELGIVKKIENGEIELSQVCEQLKGEESFFGLCKLSSGALLESVIYPNPASDHAKLKFLLTESRKIEVGIYEQTGRMVKSILTKQDISAGDHDYNLDLSGLQNGFYLVIIQSDKGEQIVQRLIVK
jgi:hypothetical protein